MIAIIVHGGAGKANSKEEIPGRIETCKYAAKTGFDILESGGSAIDAAVEAVKIFEDDPFFNAGRGAYLNKKGEVELDSGIMDGESLKSGAASGIKHIKNPILLAKMIMEKSPHRFLISEGAEEFAMKNQLEIVPNSYFITKEKREIYLKKLNKTQESDTVGAVALDEKGHIASAVSTGGTPFKEKGRVGDSPIIGSGFFANNIYGAVATGIGEDIMKAVLSFRINLYINEGIEYAVQQTIDDLTKLNGKAGIIALDKRGNIAYKYNTELMFYGFMKEGMKEPEGGI